MEKPEVKMSPAGAADLRSVSPLEANHDGLKRMFDCRTRVRAGGGSRNLSDPAPIRKGASPMNRGWHYLPPYRAKRAG